MGGANGPNLHPPLKNTLPLAWTLHPFPLQVQNLFKKLVQLPHWFQSWRHIQPMCGENTFSLARSNFFCRMKKKLSCVWNNFSLTLLPSSHSCKRDLSFGVVASNSQQRALFVLRQSIVAGASSSWEGGRIAEFFRFGCSPLCLFALFTAFSGKQHEYMLLMPFIASKSLVYQAAGLKTKYMLQF